jgi:hypothetical protein
MVDVLDSDVRLIPEYGSCMAVKYKEHMSYSEFQNDRLCPIAVSDGLRLWAIFWLTGVAV